MTENLARDIDSDDEDIVQLDWLLGFAEPPQDAAEILRHNFPSKIGGRPAWLDPVHLPSKEQLTCGATGEPLQFLLQVYAPYDDNPNSFHRTVYLFISANGDQLTTPGAVKALRCQLPRENTFYPFHPEKITPPHPPQLTADQMEEAIARDPWKAEEHAQRQSKKQKQQQRASAEKGQQSSSNIEGKAQGPILLPEAELVVEPEPDDGQADDAQTKAIMEQYNARNAQEGEYTEEELPGEVIDTLEDAVNPEQRHFAEFAARVAIEPSQCLRYCFDPAAVPLCPSSTGIPGPGDIPRCERCGGARQFEFQVMPQLLHFLGVDASDPHAPDWGTIAVYSCAGSCGSEEERENAYVEEYVWVQPPT